MAGGQYEYTNINTTTKLYGTAIEPDPPEAPIDPKAVDERNDSQSNE